MKSFLRCVSVFTILILAGCAEPVMLAVPDMMCEESCAVQVREVLEKQPGVERVKVDFSKRLATLAVDKSAFNADSAIAALVDHGFEHAAIKTDNLPVTPIVNETPMVTAETTTEAIATSSE